MRHYVVTSNYASYAKCGKIQMASSTERFVNTKKIIKQLLNSVLRGFEELLRHWFLLSASAFGLGQYHKPLPK